MGRISKEDKGGGPAGPNPDLLNPQEQDPVQQAATHARMLIHTVEHEIIPRLVRAHRTEAGGTVQAFAARGAISPADLEHFVQRVRHGQDADVEQCIAALQARGVPFRRLLLDLLAPAARRMGEHWTSDLCDFNEVTMAVGRLQRVLRDHSALLNKTSPARPASGRRSILLAACPGEQHTFGLSMVAEFFHQAGWDVTTSFLSLDQPPAKLVQENWYDVVGLTVGSNANMPRLVRCIADLRQSSVNSRIPIIAGGSVFVLHPELEAGLMVDAVITDGSAAPALAERLIERVSARA